MGVRHHVKIKQMLSNISAMIAEADECREELAHVKKYHSELSAEDLAAQFRLAERMRHIEQIEKRLNACLDKLKSHKQTLVELIEIDV